MQRSSLAPDENLVARGRRLRLDDTRIWGDQMKPPSPPGMGRTSAGSVMSQRRPVLFPLGLKRSEMSKRPSQPWSSEDEARLRALAAAGRSTATIAERLKRPPAAIRYKAMRLNIVIQRVRAKRAKPQEKNKEKIPPPNRLNP